jgi:hypothetical protein
VAARRAREDGPSDDLPTRTSGRVAIFDEGYPEGVQKDIKSASGCQLLANSM